jgi:hypothetical protein
MKNIILFLTACLFLSCQKPEPNIYLLSQKIKAYTLFKQGTKWIYKQEGQVALDTQIVAKEVTELRKMNKINDDRSEVHERDIYSTFFKSTFSCMSGKARNNTSENFESYTEVFYTSYFDVRCLFFVDMPVGYFYENGPTTYISYHPTYTVEGKTYNEVMVFEAKTALENTGQLELRLPKKVWFAKNVGIIKRELSNGQVWNLIHHEVKQ